MIYSIKLNKKTRTQQNWGKKKKKKIANQGRSRQKSHCRSCVQAETCSQLGAPSIKSDVKSPETNPNPYLGGFSSKGKRKTAMGGRFEGNPHRQGLKGIN